MQYVNTGTQSWPNDEILSSKHLLIAFNVYNGNHEYSYGLPQLLFDPNCTARWHTSV